MRGSLMVFLLAAGSAAAQPQPPNPDWPCQQRLIPELQAGSYWTGPPVPTGDYSWHDDEKLTALVDGVVDRDTPDAEATATLAAYADSLPASERLKAIPRLFGALVGETNDERGQVIARIETISRRQRELGDLISQLSNQADAIPATATGADAAKKADLVGQRDFNIQAFKDAQFTVRYACEVPGNYDRRLGLFARTLAGKLGK